MSGFWADKRVLVTGGDGFIGQQVVQVLHDRGVHNNNLLWPSHYQCELQDLDQCMKWMKDCQVVIHLAARTGGIQYSAAHPASQYRACSLIDLNVFEAAHLVGIQKLICLGTLLAYPAHAAQPLWENMLHMGPVAPTHLGIGIAKRNQALMCEMYHREYSLNAVTVLSANAYGPGDRFDPAVAHVIPATIIKCHKDEPLVVWGDGSPTRDFLFVTDVAEGVVLAAERMNAPDCIINLSSGQEISIRALVELIARLSEFKHKIIFDVSKGGGDQRRVADDWSARIKLSFTPRMSLEEGLWRTIEWYRRHQ